MGEGLKYLSWFGAHHETEAVAGALPRGQNWPQKAPFGLYAEQLPLTAFTAPRAQNLRSWLYRLRPSTMHPPFRPVHAGLLRTGPCREADAGPNRLRWAPMAMPRKATDFVAGLVTIATSGDARAHAGIGVHLYAANRSMRRVFAWVLVAGGGRTLYAGTFDGGVFRSEDGGETWRPISRALPNDSIRGIVVGRDGLIVATGRGIFKTLDGGRQWMPLNAGLTELSVQTLASSGDGVFYAGTSAGAFRSDDEGRHWVNISEGMVEPPSRADQ